MEKDSFEEEEEEEDEEDEAPSSPWQRPAPASRKKRPLEEDGDDTEEDATPASTTKKRRVAEKEEKDRSQWWRPTTTTTTTTLPAATGRRRRRRDMEEDEEGEGQGQGQRKRATVTLGPVGVAKKRPLTDVDDADDDAVDALVAGMARMHVQKRARTAAPVSRKREASLVAPMAESEEEKGARQRLKVLPSSELTDDVYAAFVARGPGIWHDPHFAAAVTAARQQNMRVFMTSLIMHRDVHIHARLRRVFAYLLLPPTLGNEPAGYKALRGLLYYGSDDARDAQLLPTRPFGHSLAIFWQWARAVSATMTSMDEYDTTDATDTSDTIAMDVDVDVDANVNGAHDALVYVARRLDALLPIRTWRAVYMELPRSMLDVADAYVNTPLGWTNDALYGELGKCIDTYERETEGIIRDHVQTLLLALPFLLAAEGLNMFTCFYHMRMAFAFEDVPEHSGFDRLAMSPARKEAAAELVAAILSNNARHLDGMLFDRAVVFNNHQWRNLMVLMAWAGRSPVMRDCLPKMENVLRDRLQQARITGMGAGAAGLWFGPGEKLSVTRLAERFSVPWTGAPVRRDAEGHRVLAPPPYDPSMDDARVALRDAFFRRRCLLLLSDVNVRQYALPVGAYLKLGVSEVLRRVFPVAAAAVADSLTETQAVVGALFAGTAFGDLAECDRFRMLTYAELVATGNATNMAAATAPAYWIVVDVPAADAILQGTVRTMGQRWGLGLLRLWCCDVAAVMRHATEAFTPDGRRAYWWCVARWISRHAIEQAPPASITAPALLYMSRQAHLYCPADVHPAASNGSTFRLIQRGDPSVFAWLVSPFSFVGQALDTDRPALARNIVARFSSEHWVAFFDALFLGPLALHTRLHTLSAEKRAQCLRYAANALDLALALPAMGQMLIPLLDPHVSAGVLPPLTQRLLICLRLLLEHEQGAALARIASMCPTLDVTATTATATAVANGTVAMSHVLDVATAHASGRLPLRTDWGPAQMRFWLAAQHQTREETIRIHVSLLALGRLPDPMRAPVERTRATTLAYWCGALYPDFKALWHALDFHYDRAAS